jgi:hypothetical protein
MSIVGANDWSGLEVKGVEDAYGEGFGHVG